MRAKPKAFFDPIYFVIFSRCYWAFTPSWSLTLLGSLSSLLLRCSIQQGTLALVSMLGPWQDGVSSQAFSSRWYGSCWPCLLGPQAQLGKEKGEIEMYRWNSHQKGMTSEPPCALGASKQTLRKNRLDPESDTWLLRISRRW